MENTNNPRTILSRRKDVLVTYIQELERQIDYYIKAGTTCTDLESRRDTLEIRLNEVVYLITKYFQ